MAKQAPIQRLSCSKCGKTLPINDMGVPVTSLWRDGDWICPDCWMTPTMHNQEKTNAESTSGN